MSAERSVTTAAYLLFYRRRSEKPLGGPRMQGLLAEDEDKTSEASADDEDSPSGDGERLDDTSRTGSSSAFGPKASGVSISSGRGVSRLADGGHGGVRLVDPVEEDDEDADGRLPPYSSLMPLETSHEDFEMGETGGSWPDFGPIVSSSESD
jgi:ubiquitin carboxyl-terminal hydrolase 4/11/15